VATKKILLVDDSDRMRRLVRRVLQPAHYEIIEACDGHQALEVLDRHTDLALVICDVHMPGMNGLEVLKAAVAKSTPQVLMLTSEASGELIAEAKQIGAKAWLVKPFSADLLLAIVNKLAGA
jgi:two-component system chemotaxis response regulator CheY